MAVIEIQSAAQWSTEHDKAKGKLVVVDFSAEWCGPCKAIAPTYLQFSDRYSKEAIFLKLDVDKVKEIAQQERIEGMPSFGFYVKRERIEFITGGDPRKLEDAIKSAIAKFHVDVFAGKGNVLGAPSSKPTVSSSNTSSSASGAKPSGRFNPWASKDFVASKLQTSDKPSTSSSSTNSSSTAAKKPSTSTPWSDPNFKPPTNTATTAAKPTPNAQVSTSSNPIPTSQQPNTVSASMNDPKLIVSSELLSQLESMGFPALRAEKSLIMTKNKSLEAAIDWLESHQNDMDIDQPLAVVGTQSKPAESSSSAQPPPGLSEDEEVLWYEMNEKKNKQAASSTNVANKTASAPTKEASKAVVDMSSSEKMIWLANKKAEVKAKREAEAMASAKSTEKNRQNLTKSVNELKEKKEDLENKKFIAQKQKEELEKRQAKAAIMAKINASKQEKLAKQQKELEAVRAAKAKQEAANK